MLALGLLGEGGVVDDGLDDGGGYLNFGGMPFDETSTPLLHHLELLQPAIERLVSSRALGHLFARGCLILA